MILAAGELDDSQRHAVLGLLARVEAHDGVAPVGEAGLLGMRAPHPQVTHLLALEGPTLAGYAWSDGATAELAVAPEWRRRGHGSALLRRVTAAPDVAVWAHGTLPPAVALARLFGLRATRELWHMEWQPGDVVVPPAPDGLQVRPFAGGADDDDARAWVALNARVFAGHPEQGRLGLVDLAARMAEPWFDPATFLLATVDEHLVAYGWLKRDGEEAEVYVLGVAAEFERRGIAAHLLARMQEAAVGAGARALTLYVEGDNLAAIRSYERAGFRRDSMDSQFSVSTGAADRTSEVVRWRT